MDSNQVIEQQERKQDSVSEQTTSNEHLHNELNTGKLTETAGDAGQTYHQYQHEQETLTELEMQKEHQCICDSD